MLNFQHHYFSLQLSHDPSEIIAQYADLFSMLEIVVLLNIFLEPVILFY